MKSANQQYRDSGSDLSFKTWLKGEQDKGVLKNNDKMFNLTGDKKVKQVKGMKTNDIIGMVAVGFLAFGLYQISKTDVE